MEPRLLDTTLREGQQSLHPGRENEGVVFNEEQQLQIAKKLIDFGIDYLELGAPVRSKSQEKTARKIISQAKKSNTEVYVHTRCVKEDIELVLGMDFDGLNLFFNSSKAMNMSDLDKKRHIVEVVEFARKNSSGRKIRFSFEDAFRNDLKKILGLIGELENYVDRLGMPDTVGAADPETVKKYIKKIKSKYPEFELECHFHNDAGLAVANAKAAFEAGAGILDTTVLGLGERNGITSLSGMIAALLLNKNIAEIVKNKYRLETLIELDTLVSEILGMDIPLNMPLTSRSAFVHVAGVHANGQVADKKAYQNFDPKDFGIEPVLVWASAVTGKTSIMNRAVQLNRKLEEKDARILADKVRELARENGGVSFKEVDQMILSNSKK